MYAPADGILQPLFNHECCYQLIVTRILMQKATMKAVLHLVFSEAGKNPEGFMKQKL